MKTQLDKLGPNLPALVQALVRQLYPGSESMGYPLLANHLVQLADRLEGYADPYLPIDGELDQALFNILRDGGNPVAQAWSIYCDPNGRKLLHKIPLNELTAVLESEHQQHLQHLENLRQIRREKQRERRRALSEERDRTDPLEPGRKRRRRQLIGVKDRFIIVEPDLASGIKKHAGMISPALRQALETYHDIPMSEDEQSYTFRRIPGREQICCTLRDADFELAQTLGNGNASAGARVALRRYLAELTGKPWEPTETLKMLLPEPAPAPDARKGKRGKQKQGGQHG